MTNHASTRFRKRVAGVSMLLSLSCFPAISAADRIHLGNWLVTVQIDRQTGGIRSVRDKEQDVEYQMQGSGFAITTGDGAPCPVTATSVKGSDKAAEFCYSSGGLEVRLQYRLGPGDRFIEKWLEIRNAGDKPCPLGNVVLEDVMLGPGFKEIHFHDDQTKWHCPISLFLRGEKGGCIAGLEYPYWKFDQRGRQGFRLGLAPNYPVGPGEK